MKTNKNAKKKNYSSVKSGGTKKLGMPVKKQKKIIEYYYMTPQETNAKDISLCITAVPEDQIKSIYQISFEVEDTDLVRKVMTEILEHKGGMILSDTDTFEPIYDVNSVASIG